MSALGRESRITAFGLVLCVATIGLAGLEGCDRAAEPALAPQLLFDADETRAYLDEFPKSDYEIAEVPGLGKFYIDEHGGVVKQQLASGKPWEWYVIRELEKHLTPGDTALDIGAHIGSLTVAMARLVGPEGRVYAFEPQMKNYLELVHNLELNQLTNAVPLRFALSSETGIIEMEPVAGHAYGRVRVGKGGGKVEARTIDSFGFTDLSLMKIDVESHEADVLRGATKTIEALHPVIIIEVWKHGGYREIVMPILEGHGYTVRPISAMDFVAIYEPESGPQ